MQEAKPIPLSVITSAVYNHIIDPIPNSKEATNTKVVIIIPVVDLEIERNIRMPQEIIIPIWPSERRDFLPILLSKGITNKGTRQFTIPTIAVPIRADTSVS
mmetsp:Transcript_17677/g.15593  ORF Transcript_17677/g.15593 Transcript_17677/m.15593 type:complete len:102 (-) Transcript_17677:889-1194(-)